MSVYRYLPHINYIFRNDVEYFFSQMLMFRIETFFLFSGPIPTVATYTSCRLVPFGVHVRHLDFEYFFPLLKVIYI